MKKVIILAMTVSIWVSGICNPLSSNAVYEKAKQELLRTTNKSKYEPYRYIWNYFIQKGISPQVTAGIMGNMYIESKFNSTVRSSSGYYGYVQMSKSLQRLVSKKYGSLSSNSQLLHISNWVKGLETGELAYMQNSFSRMQFTSPEHAAQAFAKYYERPKSKNYMNRMHNARLIYDYFMRDRK